MRYLIIGILWFYFLLWIVNRIEQENERIMMRIILLIAICATFAQAQQPTDICLTKDSADKAYLALRDNLSAPLELVRGTNGTCVDVWLRGHMTGLSTVERLELRNAIQLARGIPAEKCDGIGAQNCPRTDIGPGRKR